MLRYREIRKMVQSCESDAQAKGQSLREARLNFVRLFHDTMGVGLDADATPTFRLKESTGKPELLPNSCKPEEVSLRNLAEAIMGHEFVNNFYHPSSGYNFNNPLTEAAIDPTAFININTFNLSVSGLVNAEILEQFNLPEYIGDRFVTVKPTTMNGQKLIGVQRPGIYSSASKGRMPGQPHAEIGFGERYQTTPETVEQAQKIKVTKEAVFFDLTGQVIEQAGEVGLDLGYGREKDIADGVLGVTNSHNYNGTSYNTYQTDSPWINDHGNTFNDEDDLDAALQLFYAMTDPDTSREILVTPQVILHMPPRIMRFNKFFFGTVAHEGTQASGGFPNRWMDGSNPIDKVAPQLKSNMVSSQLWYNRATASDGLALSAANAKEYWYIGDPKKAFEWRENWPLTPWTASPNELVMKDQGLVAVYGANYRGVFYVRQPRYMVRNKNG